jgi:hypothetical protein
VQKLKQEVAWTSKEQGAKLGFGAKCGIPLVQLLSNHYLQFSNQLSPVLQHFSFLFIPSIAQISNTAISPAEDKVFVARHLSPQKKAALHVHKKDISKISYFRIACIGASTA